MKSLILFATLVLVVYAQKPQPTPSIIQSPMMQTPEVVAPSPEASQRLSKMMSEGFDEDGDNFNIFSALMKSSGFDKEMKDTAGKNMTVFVPTDSAFMRTVRVFGGTPKSEESTYDALMEALGEGVELQGVKVKGRNLLRALLAYHMVGGLIDKDELEKATMLVTSLGVPITFPGNGEIIDLSPDTPNAMVIRPEMMDDDGTIMHALDYVLLPFDREAEKLPICK